MTQLIEYNVTQAAIAELTQEKEALLTASELDYKAIKDAKNRNGKIRIAIEKRRKEYKADALEHGRKVDSKAKESSEPVTAIEDAYKEVLNKRDAELDAVRVAAERKEQARIAFIKHEIDIYRECGAIGPYFSSAELSSHLERLQEYITTSFNFQEFLEEMKGVFKDTEERIKTALKSRLQYESEQAEQESQRKKDNEARIALQAEKDAFEQEQRDAQAKIDFELAAIQEEKDVLRRAEIEREKKRQQEIHEAKMQEAEEQLAKQRVIDEEKRKKAEETERLRLEQVAKEDAERKAANAAEDRVRNAAPELLNALKKVDEGLAMQDQDTFSAMRLMIRNVIKLAEGE